MGTLGVPSTLWVWDTRLEIDTIVVGGSTALLGPGLGDTPGLRAVLAMPVYFARIA